MEDSKPYYIYRYDLGADHIDIEEVIHYDFEDINQIESSVNNCGKLTFHMYSDAIGYQELFLSKISHILAQDATAAYRAYEIAIGKYHWFDSIWRKISETANSVD